MSTTAVATNGKKATNGGQIAAKVNGNAKPAPSNIKEWIGAYKNQFAKALPSAITPERFTRMALSAISQTPALQQCSAQSFLGALMNAAQLGLEPNTPLGQAYLIPYKNHGRNECRFEIGYKGLIDLAYRSGELRSLQAHIVYENDAFEFEYGLNPKLVHKPALGDRGAAIYVYAVFKLVNGGEGFQVMSMDGVREHAKKYSKAYNSGPWQTNFEEMAKKTVVKRLLKYAPLKSEFVKGVVTDETNQMLQVPADSSDEIIIKTEVIEIDPETGEVIEDGVQIQEEAPAEDNR